MLNERKKATIELCSPQYGLHGKTETHQPIGGLITLLFGPCREGGKHWEVRTRYPIIGVPFRKGVYDLCSDLLSRSPSHGLIPSRHKALYVSPSFDS